MCGLVLVLINKSSTWVLNWAECEIWQAWEGLCGLPLHSNRHVDMDISCQREFAESSRPLPSAWWRLGKAGRALYQYFNILALMEQLSRRQYAWDSNVRQMSPVEQRCEQEHANEGLLTLCVCVCLIKVGGLEPWWPNMCKTELPAYDLESHSVGLNVIYLDILYTLTNAH